MPAARDDAPEPTWARSTTTTRLAPSARAKTDAQPPTVPAPTTTRSARSAIECRGLGADGDDAEADEAVVGGPSTDGIRGDLQPGCARRVHRALIDRPPVERDRATAELRRGPDRGRRQPRSVQPARPARGETGDAVQGGPLERRDDG